jgi:hypothetical protein
MFRSQYRQSQFLHQSHASTSSRMLLRKGPIQEFVVLSSKSKNKHFFVMTDTLDIVFFYEFKALKASMKSGVLSKLAAQVSDYYEVCYNLIVTTNLKNVVPKVTHCYQMSITDLNFSKLITLYRNCRSGRRMWI